MNSQPPSLMTGFKIGLVAVAGMLAAFTLLATVAATTTFLPRDGSQPMSGNLDLDSNRIVNVASATAAGDAVSRAFGDSRYCQLATCAMAGTLNMGNNGLTNVASVSLDPGGAIQTETTTGNTVIFRARDTDGGGSWTTFLTLTAGSTPSMTLGDATLADILTLTSDITLQKQSAYIEGGIRLDNAAATVPASYLQVGWHSSGSIEINHTGGTGALVLTSDQDQDVVLGQVGTVANPETGRVYVRRQADATDGSPLQDSHKFFLQGSRFPVAGAATKVELGVTFTPTDRESAVGKWVFDSNLNLDLVDNGILFTGSGLTGVLVKQTTTNRLDIRTQADDGWLGLKLSALEPTSHITAAADAVLLRTNGVDDNYIAIQARDNGVGYAEVGRFASAADPYVAFGGSQEHKFYYSGSAVLGTATITSTQVSLGGAAANAYINVGGSITASSGAAHGTRYALTLTGAANNDIMAVETYAGTTWAKGAYTGLTAAGLRILGANFAVSGTGTIDNAYGIWVQSAPTIGTANYGARIAGYTLSDGGLMVGAASTDNLIDDASNGGASTALYIGNASIDVTVSDARLKTNWGMPGPAMPLLRTLSGQLQSYEYLPSQNWPGTFMGWGAQNLWDAVPEARHLVIKPTNPDDTWSVRYGQLVPYVIKGLTETDKRVSDLEARIAILEAQLIAK